MPVRKDSKSFLGDFHFQVIYNSNVLSIFTNFKAGQKEKETTHQDEALCYIISFQLRLNFNILNKFYTVRQPYDQKRRKKFPCGDVALIKGTSFARTYSFIMAVRGFLTRKQIALDKQFCQKCIYCTVMTGTLIYFVLCWSVALPNKRKYQRISYIQAIKGNGIFT